MFTIEDFDIGQCIGRGGFGAVYRARNRQTNEQVAIKICERPLDSDHKAIQRLQNEVSIHHQLRHTNIVSMLGCFEDEHCIYIVLELCAGGSMFQFLQRTGPITEDLAVRVTQQLIGALDYMHSRGIIHRDLKLSNILLTGDLQDRNAVVKICDFGLAVRKQHPDEEQFTLCGTPNYMAPEVASQKAHSYPADLWSVGCLFYSMVMGYPPFEQENPQETLRHILTGEYDEPDGRDMSQHGKNFLRGLFELNPAKRANVRDLLAHPLLSPATSTTLSPISEHSSALGEDSRWNAYFSPQQEVSVGRRSNPTSAAWDEIDSTDALRANSNKFHSPIQSAVGSIHAPNENKPKFVMKLSDVLMDDDGDFFLSEKPQRKSAELQFDDQSESRGTTFKAITAQKYETGKFVSESSSRAQSLREYNEKVTSLQQQLSAYRAEFQRNLLHYPEEFSESQMTASTALVSYPHTQVPSRKDGYRLAHKASGVAQQSPRSVLDDNSQQDALQRPTPSQTEPTQTSRAVRLSPTKQVGAVTPPGQQGVARAQERPNPASISNVLQPSPVFNPQRSGTARVILQETLLHSPTIKASTSGAAAGLSTSFLHGLSFDANRSSSSWTRSSQSWLDSIDEIGSSLNANSPPARVRAEPTFQDWPKQHAYERFVGATAASPRSVGSNLSADRVAVHADEPLSASNALSSIQKDLQVLRPFCLTSSRREVLLLSTDKQLLYCVEVDRHLPDGTIGKQYLRVLVSPSDHDSLLFGHINADMRQEIDSLSAEIASGCAKKGKSHAIDDLNASYTDDGRAATHGRDGTIGGLKYHHNYTAAALLVFDVSGTRSLNVNVESAVPPLVLNMLQRVCTLLAAAKGRMPKLVVYFSAPVDASPHAIDAGERKLNCKCMLMSNDPFPDFYVQWNDGAKLRYELKTGLYRIQKPQVTSGKNAAKALSWSGVLDSPTGSTGKSGILPELVPYVAVAQKALSKCLAETHTSNGGVPKIYTLD